MRLLGSTSSSTKAPLFKEGSVGVYPPCATEEHQKTTFVDTEMDT